MPDNIDSEQALTEHITRFTNSVVLKVNTSADPSAIHPSDIDRCHFVGKQKKQILVKFMRYESKRKVFMNKKNLKGYPMKIYINEDLTKFNFDLLQSVNEVKRLSKDKDVNPVHSFWTRNGSVFFKKTRKVPPGENTHRIRPFEVYTVEHCRKPTKQN